MTVNPRRHPWQNRSVRCGYWLSVQYLDIHAGRIPAGLKASGHFIAIEIQIVQINAFANTSKPYPHFMHFQGSWQEERVVELGVDAEGRLGRIISFPRPPVQIFSLHLASSGTSIKTGRCLISSSAQDIASIFTREMSRRRLGFGPTRASMAVRRVALNFRAAATRAPAAVPPAGARKATYPDWDNSRCSCKRHQGYRRHQSYMPVSPQGGAARFFCQMDSSKLLKRE